MLLTRKHKAQQTINLLNQRLKSAILALEILDHGTTQLKLRAPLLTQKQDGTYQEEETKERGETSLA